MLKKIAVALAGLLVLLVPAAAEARTNPYFREQCETGVITWSVEGGRVKIAKKAIAWVAARFPNYEFRQVPEYWDAMLSIEMQAKQPKHHPRWLGVTYLWRTGKQIDRAEIQIFVNKNREGIFLVTVHEVLHGMGIPHYNKSLSIMNSIGLSGFYPVDERLVADQNALCRL